jgi:hypothetical protein
MDGLAVDISLVKKLVLFAAALRAAAPRRRPTVAK